MIVWGIFFLKKQDVFPLVFEMLAAQETGKIFVFF